MDGRFSGLKRKWEVASSNTPFNDLLNIHQKKVCLSVQLGSAIPQSDSGSIIGSDVPTEVWSLQGTTVFGSDIDEMDMEDRNQEDSDIPSTSEVINSLRKVILWMSAQDDHNNDYIQYLTDVEHYALSKQPNIQQRKITQYFTRD